MFFRTLDTNLSLLDFSCNGLKGDRLSCNRPFGGAQKDSSSWLLMVCSGDDRVCSLFVNGEFDLWPEVA